MPVDPTGRLGDDLALALRLADEASALALGFFRCGARAGSKADGTVVTDGDIAVEQFLSAGLGTARPGDAILGEELGATGSAPRRWVLDPIDGTRNFVAGRADWGVHIALESEGRQLPVQRVPDTSRVVHEGRFQATTTSSWAAREAAR